MTSIPGKLTIKHGAIAGPARIDYNSPFPTKNGTPGGGASSMMGVVMHTTVGTMEGTIATFNDPASSASAFFAVGTDGLIHQFGPVGANWEAWAQMAGNPAWYSIEFADNGDPDTPLTQAQVTAGAQLLECLSAFAGFPLQVTDSTEVQGFGTHVMGGAAWGGHTCPDVPPKHVRSAQRAAIVELAKAIRAGTAMREVHCPHGQWTRVGGVEVQPATHDVVLLVR